MKKSSSVSTVEYERLFGNGVDLFKNYYAVLGISNILENIGVRTSHDSDWFRTVAEYVTVAELSGLYDKIIPLTFFFTETVLNTHLLFNDRNGKFITPPCNSQGELLYLPQFHGDASITTNRSTGYGLEIITFCYIEILLNQGFCLTHHFVF